MKLSPEPEAYARDWWGEPTRGGSTYERMFYGQRYRCTNVGTTWVVLHVSQIGAVAFKEVDTLAEASDAVIAHRKRSR